MFGQLNLLQYFHFLLYIYYKDCIQYLCVILYSLPLFQNVVIDCFSYKSRPSHLKIAYNGLDFLSLTPEYALLAFSFHNGTTNRF